MHKNIFNVEIVYACNYDDVSVRWMDIMKFVCEWCHTTQKELYNCARNYIFVQFGKFSYSHKDFLRYYEKNTTYCYVILVVKNWLSIINIFSDGEEKNVFKIIIKYILNFNKHKNKCYYN